MAWSGFSGSGEYAVRVERLPDMAVVYSTTTTNTTATVTGLNTGTTYRYTVTRGADFIITDLETP